MKELYTKNTESLNQDIVTEIVLDKEPVNSITQHEIWNYMKIVNKLNIYMIGHNGFVAGGCFKNLFNGEKVKDIDMFFRSKEDYLNALDVFSKDEEYRKYYDNKKVQAFVNKHTGVVVELIKYKFGEPEEVIKDFDFTITKVAYINNYKTEDEMEDLIGELDTDDDIEDFLHESYFLIHNDFFEHLHTKRLVVDDKMVLPINSYERLFRYGKYGFFPCRETKLKIIRAIRDLDDFDDELLSRGLYDGMD